MKLRKKKSNCECVFAGFEPVSLCGKHAKELYEHVAAEIGYASKWKSIADGLYDVAMCEVSDKICRCADHVAAYERMLAEENK
jgi:hypothetical protein